MGIYVRLESPERISLVARALARLHYSYEAIRFFHKGHIFIPENVAIWLKAPSETLGGTLEKEIPLTDLYKSIDTLRRWFASEFYSRELFSSIVVFNGKWDLNGEKLEGFVSANNEYSWQRAYFDVEIDVYARGKIEDLVDAFWGKPELENLFPNFADELRRAGRGQLQKPTTMYFSTGAPEYGELDNLIALYIQDRRTFIDFLYSKLHKRKEDWVKDRIDPIDRSFFVRAVNEQKAVQTLFASIAKESLLSEQSGGSVIYLAKERDSFAKFYRDFKKRIFRPISQQLPEAKELKSKMLKAVEKIETLG